MQCIKYNKYKCSYLTLYINTGAYGMGKPVSFKHLSPWATERDQEYIDAIDAYGSMRRAASKLNVNYSSIAQAMARLKDRAATKKPVVDISTTPLEGPYIYKGASQLHHSEKGILMTWHKTAVDHDKYMAMMDAVRAAFTDTLPRLPIAPIKTKEKYISDIVPCINIGDAHIGMLCHRFETGADFDLKIAERELCTALSMQFDSMNMYENVCLNFMGDTVHTEIFGNETERSGNKLDVDTRYPKMIKVWYTIVRFCIEKALEKCKTVTVTFVQGNHSRTVDIASAEYVEGVYGHTGRVVVTDNSGHFVPLRIGNTLIVMAHGDGAKGERLADAAIADWAQDFGESKHRYVWMGHVHHHKVSQERGLVLVESFNVLGPTDKYAHDNGFRSRRCMTTVYIHKLYGEKSREYLTIDEIQDYLSFTGVAEKPVALRALRVC